MSRVEFRCANCKRLTVLNDPSIPQGESTEGWLCIVCIEVEASPFPGKAKARP